MSRFINKKFQELEAYTPGEQPTDMKYIKLNTNESPFPPTPEALRMARVAAERENLYSDPACTDLRAALAERYSVLSENVICTNGSDEVLYFAFLAFCDEKTGAAIVLKAIEEPIRQIAKNAGLDGSVIVDKVLSSKKANYGFDALNNKYCDMVESGIIDPTKVTRSVLQNAASVAATLLTTESIVTDIPTPPAPMAPAGGDMGGMY